MADIIINSALTYAAIGAVVAVVFVTVGLRRIGPAAARSSPIFRLFVLPATIVIWPLALGAMLRTGAGPGRRP